MRSNRLLKELVSYLRQCPFGDDTILIESPKRLRNKSTGRFLHHDAVLTITSWYHTVLVAVQCRERSSPVGLPQIEEFARKCTATCICRSVIVSLSGFTKPALIKAKTLGIHCLSLDQARSFPWFRCDAGTRQVRTCYTHIDFVIIPENDFMRKPTSYTLITDDGDLISPGRLRDYLMTELMQQRCPPYDQAGNNVERIRLMPGNLSIMDTETGVIKKVRQINLVVYSKNVKTDMPFLVQGSEDTLADSPALLPGLLKDSNFREVGIILHRGSN
ncbi:MAG TPA: restriction endonuclease [Desulfomonilia bacterium]|nr:restriction endonuclease [Desulfomonilia bacterium]